MKCFNVIKLICLLSLSVIIGCSESYNEYRMADVKLEKFNWKGKVPRSYRVKVINPYGNINSRTGSYPIVDVSGVMQLIGPDAVKGHIDVREESGVTVIEVKYPSGIYDQVGRKIARFDIGVFVPTGVFLELETDFGDIKIKKHKNRILARTNSGDIAGSTKNIIHAFSRTGDINLNLMPWKSHRFAKLAKRPSYFINTDQGDIALSMNDDLAVNMRLYSNEPILSNNLFIQNTLNQDKTSLKITRENASRLLEAKSKNGALKLDLYAKPNTKKSTANMVDVVSSLDSRRRSLSVTQPNLADSSIRSNRSFRFLL
jgi:hypothetical protein